MLYTMAQQHTPQNLIGYGKTAMWPLKKKVEKFSVLTPDDDCPIADDTLLLIIAQGKEEAANRPTSEFLADVERLYQARKNNEPDPKPESKSPEIPVIIQKRMDYLRMRILAKTLG